MLPPQRQETEAYLTQNSSEDQQSQRARHLPCHCVRAHKPKTSEHINPRTHALTHTRSSTRNIHAPVIHCATTLYHTLHHLISLRPPGVLISLTTKTTHNIDRQGALSSIHIYATLSQNIKLNQNRTKNGLSGPELRLWHG